MIGAPRVRLLLAGGGSGGHVYPLLAVTEELKKIAIQRKTILELHYFGPVDDYAQILRQNGVEMHGLVAGKIRRYFSLANFVDVPKFFFGTFQALWKLFWLMPDAIFSKGGTGALPVVLVGWLYRIPIVIHESDATPGLTNLLSGFFASRIAVSFERASNYFPQDKVAFIGTPIRSQLLAGKKQKEESKEALGFNSQEPLVLILGGSQGSKRIDEFVVQSLPNILKETQLLLQTGAEQYRETEMLARAALLGAASQGVALHRYQAVGFFEENLATALSAADLVVARAGSGTISELAAFGKPAVLIPLLESANDHQRINAYEFAKTGAATVIEETNLLPGIFVNQLREILRNKSALEKMGSAAGKFFKAGAAETIAREILRMVTGKP